MSQLVVSYMLTHRMDTIRLSPTFLLHLLSIESSVLCLLPSSLGKRIWFSLLFPKIVFSLNMIILASPNSTQLSFSVSQFTVCLQEGKPQVVLHRPLRHLPQEHCCPLINSTLSNRFPHVPSMRIVSSQTWVFCLFLLEVFLDWNTVIQYLHDIINCLSSLASLVYVCITTYIILNRQYNKNS